jgi:hypothetical protein
MKPVRNAPVDFMDQMFHTPGEIIDSRYSLKACIGCGPAGFLWEVKDLFTEQYVVVLLPMKNCLDLTPEIPILSVICGMNAHLMQIVSSE